MTELCKEAMIIEVEALSAIFCSASRDLGQSVYSQPGALVEHIY
jgi:hypothetical protein